MPIFVPAPPPPARPPTWEAPRVPTISLRGAGDSIECTAREGMVVTAGLQGFDLPPAAATVSTPGGWDGGHLEQVRWTVRDVYVPLHMFAGTTELFRALKVRLVRLVDPKRGLVTVGVEQLDGQSRSITGTYVDGLNTTLGQVEGLLQQRVGVLVRCLDPAWLGPSVLAVELRQPGGDVFLSAPFFPMTVIASRAIGDVVVDVAGEMEAWPVTSITGPTATVTVSNGDRVWSIPAGVGAGETITVDTRRGIQSVTDQDGTNQWVRMGDSIDLWPLQPGPNHLTVTLTGTTPDTLVRIEYQPRYLTAW